MNLNLFNYNWQLVPSTHPYRFSMRDIYYSYLGKRNVYVVVSLRPPSVSQFSICTAGYIINFTISVFVPVVQVQLDF